jgi:hypothetical protein
VPRPPVLRRPLAALGAAALLVLATAACGKDDGGSAAASSSSTTPTTQAPAVVLAGCTPAPGADFVAVERHLTHGGHQLREGFVSSDTPAGHYLAADVYSSTDQLLASDLRWRIAPDGSAMAANAATTAWSSLPVVPAAQVVDHPELTACVKAALALL